MESRYVNDLILYIGIFYLVISFNVGVWEDLNAATAGGTNFC